MRFCWFVGWSGETWEHVFVWCSACCCSASPYPVVSQGKSFAWECETLIFLGAEWCLQVPVALLVVSSHMGFVQRDTFLKYLSNLKPPWQGFLCYLSLSVHKLLHLWFPQAGRASAHPVLSLHEANPRSGLGVPGSWMIADLVLVQKPWAQGFGHLPREILPWVPSAPCRA